MRQPSLLERIFFSSSDGRLRSGWRVIVQTSFQYALALLLSLAAILIGLIGSLDTPQNLLAAKAIEVLALIISILAACRWLDRRRIADFGLQPARRWADFTAGLLIAGLQMGAVFTIYQLAGWSVVQSFAWETEPVREVVRAAATLLLLFLLVGFGEELHLRGYVLQNLAEGIGRWPAVLLSSLIFALSHIFNPGGKAPMAIVGLFAAGLFFAYAYYRTGQLWLSIGLHVAWNFFENPVFGFPVSGLAVPGLIRQSIVGPPFWTGGVFGPEASPVILAILALGVGLIEIYKRLEARWPGSR